MQSKDEQTKRVLLLLKLDAKNLFQKVVTRHKEYIEIFAAKRTRDHYADVFRCRYPSASISDLAHCSTDTIMAMDQFYHQIEELRWYLEHTTDMPATIDAHLLRELKKLEKSYGTMTLYLDAELGIQSEAEARNLEEGQISQSPSEEIPIWEGASSDIFNPTNDSESGDS